MCEWPGCNKGFARQHDCKHVSISTFRLESLVNCKSLSYIDVIRPCTPPNHKQMSAKDVARHSVAWMRST